MTPFDYTVIVIVTVSVVLGWWRGLVYEVLSLLGWAAAWFVAHQFVTSVVPLLPVGWTESTRAMVAYAGLFAGTLLVCGLVAWLASKWVKRAGLGWQDGLFGGLFGLLRGALVILLLVLLAGLTGFPQQPFWREAQLSRPLENVALAAKGWLPQDVAQRVHYGNQN